jgi:hypothetical protein
MDRCCFFTGAVLIPTLLYGQLANDGPIPGRPPRRPPVQASGCTTENEPAPQQLRDDDFIAIERTSCFGRCPVYTVTLHADGTVSWQGKEYVTQTGPATAQVDSAAARSVIEKFRSAGFRALCARYDRITTDVPTALTTLRIGDDQKSVSDRADGAPEWLRELNREMELLVDTHRWIHRDPAKEVFQEFLGSESYVPKPGFTALMRASAYGDVAEIQKQLAAGADPNAQDASGWSAIMYATLATKADAIALLLRSGADPNTRSLMGQTPLMAASMSYFATGEKLELLLADGANKDIHDAQNMSALDHLDKAARTWSSERTDEYQKLQKLLR